MPSTMMLNSSRVTVASRFYWATTTLPAISTLLDRGRRDRIYSRDSRNSCRVRRLTSTGACALYPRHSLIAVCAIARHCILLLQRDQSEKPLRLIKRTRPRGAGSGTASQIHSYISVSRLCLERLKGHSVARRYWPLTGFPKATPT